MQLFWLLHFKYCYVEPAAHGQRQFVLLAFATRVW